MTNLTQTPLSLIFAILIGTLPAIFWLWFWLQEEDPEKHEPRLLIVVSFILGALIVIFAVWLEKFSATFISDKTLQIITWASIEEILKFIGVAVMVFGSGAINRPIDYPIYFIALALGFAAFENISFLINPFAFNNSIVGIITGNLRFLGSTLLHAMASAIIGNALGLSFYLKKYRALYLIGGLLCAITLHSIFNFFIIERSGENFLSVFGFLWVIAIINILIFEKLKRMSSDEDQ